MDHDGSRSEDQALFVRRVTWTTTRWARGCGTWCARPFLFWSCRTRALTNDRSRVRHEAGPCARVGRAERPRRCGAVDSLRIHHRERGDTDNGEESSQGREEEGRQEAV